MSKRKFLESITRTKNIKLIWVLPKLGIVEEIVASDVSKRFSFGYFTDRLFWDEFGMYRK